VAGWCGQGKSYQVQTREQWLDGVERVKAIRFRTGTSDRWCGQGKSYQFQNRHQWQDGVEWVKVIRFITGTSGMMLWTG